MQSTRSSTRGSAHAKAPTAVAVVAAIPAPTAGAAVPAHPRPQVQPPPAKKIKKATAPKPGNGDGAVMDDMAVAQEAVTVAEAETIQLEALAAQQAATAQATQLKLQAALKLKEESAKTLAKLKENKKAEVQGAASAATGANAHTPLTTEPQGATSAGTGTNLPTQSELLLKLEAMQSELAALRSAAATTTTPAKSTETEDYTVLALENKVQALKKLFNARFGPLQGSLGFAIDYKMDLAALLSTRDLPDEAIRQATHITDAVANEILFDYFSRKGAALPPAYLIGARKPQTKAPFLFSDDRYDFDTGADTYRLKRMEKLDQWIKKIKAAIKQDYDRLFEAIELPALSTALQHVSGIITKVAAWRAGELPPSSATDSPTVDEIACATVSDWAAAYDHLNHLVSQGTAWNIDPTAVKQLLTTLMAQATGKQIAPDWDSRRATSETFNYLRAWELRGYQQQLRSPATTAPPVKAASRPPPAQNPSTGKERDRGRDADRRGDSRDSSRHDSYRESQRDSRDPQARSGRAVRPERLKRDKSVSHAQTMTDLSSKRPSQEFLSSLSICHDWNTNRCRHEDLCWHYHICKDCVFKRRGHNVADLNHKSKDCTATPL